MSLFLNFLLEMKFDESNNDKSKVKLKNIWCSELSPIFHGF